MARGNPHPKPLPKGVSGNPSGRPSDTIIVKVGSKKVSMSFGKYLRDNMERVQKVVWTMLEDPETPAAVKFEMIKYLQTRAYGHVPQENAPGNGSVVINFGGATSNL